MVGGWEIQRSKSQAKMKSKKRRWLLEKVKYKQYPALTAPQRTLIEATEEQRKHALTVAIATQLQLRLQPAYSKVVACPPSEGQPVSDTTIFKELPLAFSYAELKASKMA
ncbi:hypothetical protein CFP56_020609 [Quercus suber]|uniref:Uncharacterized protein n=1 Tax=Quercus suber TaxID=58331 RepID=A0AAW0KF34_QUESU